MKADSLIHLVILKILSLITLGIILIRCTKYHYNNKSPDDDLLDDNDLEQGHHHHRKGEIIIKFNFLLSLHNFYSISCYYARMKSATNYNFIS